MYVISFYSFKGGAGRTVTCANMAGHIASRLGGPILLLDLDVDSAGLTSLMSYEDGLNDSNERWKKWGLGAIFDREISPGITSDRDDLFSKGLLDVSQHCGQQPGSVYFLGLETISRSTTLDDSRDADVFQDLIVAAEMKNFSAVVIDSASGLQASARLAHRFSDMLIYCCRMTYQFRMGTQEQLNHFVDEIISTERKRPKVVLLPIAVPPIPQVQQKIFTDFKSTALAHYSTLIQTQLAKMRKKFPELSKTHFRLIKDGIPEIATFKWQELILKETGEFEHEDQQQAMQVFKSLADCIAESAKGLESGNPNR